MKYKACFMIVMVVFILCVSGCGPVDKVDDILEEEKIAGSFGEFAPDFTSLLTKDIENLTGKAEANLYTQVSMKIAIESAAGNLMLMENDSDLTVNIIVESVTRSDFINLFISAEGEE